jgi:AraC family transcriptional regulator of adaptative response/methylated-DNA-[protein]-cysteine methyltransferase
MKKYILTSPQQAFEQNDCLQIKILPRNTVFRDTPCFDFYDSKYGKIFIISTSDGIFHLGFASEPFTHQTFNPPLFKTLPIRCQHALHRHALQYIDIGKCDKPLPLLLSGTQFQIEVWKLLIQIKQGALVSYGDIAALLGKPGAARAVGNAVGSNRIALLIPCHRVIASNGGIGGYYWGTALKEKILKSELNIQ